MRGPLKQGDPNKIPAMLCTRIIPPGSALSTGNSLFVRGLLYYILYVINCFIVIGIIISSSSSIDIIVIIIHFSPESSSFQRIVTFPVDTGAFQWHFPTEFDFCELLKVIQIPVLFVIAAYTNQTNSKSSVVYTPCRFKSLRRRVTLFALKAVNANDEWF